MSFGTSLVLYVQVCGLSNIAAYRFSIKERVKGTVSEDGGWDEPMAQQFGPKLMVVHTFFCLKIGRLKDIVYWVLSNTSIDEKLVLQIRGFCYDPASTSLTEYWATSLDISRCDGCNVQMVTQPLRKMTTAAILFFCSNCHKSVVHFPRLWQFAQWLCYNWHITAVTARYAKGHWKIMESGEPIFTLMDSLLYGP
jgi:hypothetical protein